MATGRQRFRFRLEALSAGLLLSAAGLLTPACSFAGSTAFFFEHQGPVIVDRSGEVPEVIRAAASAHPVAASHGPVPVQATLGNLHVERVASQACGDRTPTLLVACLDTEGRFVDSDELALLARAAQAASIEVGSLKARAAFLAALRSGSIAITVEPAVTRFANCTGACEGRVVMRSGS